MNYDEKILGISKSIDALKTEMELVSKDFLVATQVFVSNWYKEAIEEAVIRSPETTKKLGQVKLRALKNELNALIENSEQSVFSFLDTDELWAHKPNFKLEGRETHGLFEVYGNSDPKELSSAIRLIIGMVGDLLSKYNYDNSSYVDNNSTGNYSFQYGYSWSTEMREIINNYSTLFKKHNSFEDELIRVRKEKAENEAKNLWDKL